MSPFVTIGTGANARPTRVALDTRVSVCICVCICVCLSVCNVCIYACCKKPQDVVCRECLPEAPRACHPKPWPKHTEPFRFDIAASISSRLSGQTVNSNIGAPRCAGAASPSLMRRSARQATRRLTRPGPCAIISVAFCRAICSWFRVLCWCWSEVVNLDLSLKSECLHN